MLGQASLVAFAAITKVDDARRFYGETLGLGLIEDGPFALVFSAGAGALRLQKVQSFTPHPFTALGWQVEDIAASMAALAGAGVVFERFPGMEQDEAGAWTPPGTAAKVCWFKDPDGNLLSLSQGG
jgi:catechol 2,3-dioxygenase-like lactoylglutathione lyase family enzyme